MIRVFRKFAAGPDTLIQQIGIKDPLLIYFLKNSALTESVQKIDPLFWRKAKDLNEFTLRRAIKTIAYENLVPAIIRSFGTLDPKILEKNLPRLRMRGDLRNLDNDEILEKVTEDRKHILDQWIHEVVEHNDSLFNAVALSALSKSFRRLLYPPEVNSETLGATKDALEAEQGEVNNQLVDFWSLYQTQQNADQGSSYHGWRVFKKDSDPKELASAVIGSGWCIARLPMAEDYLKKIDVHIYFDGKPQVALGEYPDSGECNQVYERDNKDPVRYVEEILDYVEKNKIQITYSTSGGQNLLEAKTIRGAYKNNRPEFYHLLSTEMKYARLIPSNIYRTDKKASESVALAFRRWSIEYSPDVFGLIYELRKIPKSVLKIEQSSIVNRIAIILQKAATLSLHDIVKLLDEIENYPDIYNETIVAEIKKRMRASPNIVGVSSRMFRSWNDETLAVFLEDQTFVEQVLVPHFCTQIRQQKEESLEFFEVCLEAPKQIASHPYFQKELRDKTTLYLEKNPIQGVLFYDRFSRIINREKVDKIIHTPESWVPFFSRYRSIDDLYQVPEDVRTSPVFKNDIFQFAKKSSASVVEKIFVIMEDEIFTPVLLQKMIEQILNNFSTTELVMHEREDLIFASKSRSDFFSKYRTLYEQLNALIYKKQLEAIQQLPMSVLSDELKQDPKALQLKADGCFNLLAAGHLNPQSINPICYAHATVNIEESLIRYFNKEESHPIQLLSCFNYIPKEYHTPMVQDALDENMVKWLSFSGGANEIYMNNVLQTITQQGIGFPKTEQTINKNFQQVKMTREYARTASWISRCQK